MGKVTPLTAEHATPSKTRSQAATRQRGVVPTAELVPMQFRMPPDFAIAFRTEAARRGMKYNELLQECFATFIKAAN
jgi:hypothetical protein